MANEEKTRKEELEKIFKTAQSSVRACARESEGTGAERMANTALCVKSSVPEAVRELRKKPTPS